MKPLTNRMLGVTGDANTVPMTVRVPKEVADFIDANLTEQIKNRSEFLQHWAQVGVKVSSDPELTEALDWALDRTVQEPEPIEIRMEPEPVRATFAAEPALTELGQIRHDQLEALRSRVR